MKHDYYSPLSYIFFLTKNIERNADKTTKIVSAPGPVCILEAIAGVFDSVVVSQRALIAKS